MLNKTPIKSSDVVRFMDAKTNCKCHGCGGSDFRTVNEENLDGQHLKARLSLIGFPFPDRDFNDAKTVDMIAAICDNCGTIWPLARQIVSAWVSDNPA